MQTISNLDALPLPGPPLYRVPTPTNRRGIGKPISEAFNENISLRHKADMNADLVHTFFTK